MVLLGQGVAWLALATGASALVSTAPCAPRRPLRLALRPAASTLAPAASTDELGQHWESPLEPTLVSDHLTFAKKMEVIDAYFEARPAQVARRLGTVAAAAARVAAAWVWEEQFGPGAEARGDVLRREVSKLGVVFVKVAQTLATSEDLVGAEAAAALSVLQDANKPFDERG